MGTLKRPALTPKGDIDEVESRRAQNDDALTSLKVNEWLRRNSISSSIELSVGEGGAEGWIGCKGIFGLDESWLGSEDS